MLSANPGRLHCTEQRQEAASGPVTTLLQEGALMDVLSSEIKTALYYATKGAHLKVSCLLLAHGANRELVQGDSGVYKIVNNLQVPS